MMEVIAAMLFGFALLAWKRLFRGHSWGPRFCLHCFLRVFGTRGIRGLVCSLRHLSRRIARRDPDGFS